MVARFGNVELRLLVQLRQRLRRTGEDSLEMLSGRNSEAFKWPPFRRDAFQSRMDGKPENAISFLNQYEQAMQEVDLLGSWAFGESYFSEHLQSAKMCHLSGLEPWHSSNPWSAELAGKKVVVVHPFIETITAQYRDNRSQVFDDVNMLPTFDLRVVQAFMPGVREYPVKGGMFFEKLDRLIEEVHSEPFDVAIIGSGPNGFLIAAEVKRRGGIAIHLGGATQLLFGIRGKRWEETGFPFFNDSWVRPLPTDTPPDFSEHYDKGAYW